MGQAEKVFACEYLCVMWSSDSRLSVHGKHGFGVVAYTLSVDNVVSKILKHCTDYR
jgi:hypothetical protein